MKQTILDRIAESRLVAIVRLDDLTYSVEIAEALLAGGIVAQEFTLTNPHALDAVRKIRSEIQAFGNGQAVLGVGSVRNLDEAKRAVDAGAQFIVSPCLLPAVVEYCRSVDVACMPGVLTPTELAQAWEMGADVLKIFPARSLGPEFIKDVLAPMPYLRLMPTGGIDTSNMAAYFKNGAHAVGVGGNLFDKQAIAAGDWKRVEDVAREYATTARKHA